MSISNPFYGKGHFKAEVNVLQLVRIERALKSAPPILSPEFLDHNLSYFKMIHIR